MLTGKLRAPDLKLYPVATTNPIPVIERFGPAPNSKPLEFRIPTSELTDGRKYPCSVPPTKKTNSAKPQKFSPSENLVSSCQPYCPIKYVPNSSVAWLPFFSTDGH